jgi:hypothetical protein
MKRGRTESKVRALHPRPRAITARGGAVDYAIKTDVLSRNAVAAVDDHIYRVIELVGTSEESIQGAINAALSRAGQTLRNLRWFEVLRTSGHIAGGKVAHYQVTLKVGFTMEEAA